MNSDELKLIFILHDLGMFYQRTGQAPSNNYKDLSINDLGNRGAHPKWSASLAEEMGLSRNIQEIILYHHKPESLKGESYTIARILNKASEFFSDKEERGTESLISVFSGVQITKNKSPQNYFIPIQKLDINTFIFPQKDDRKNNYENIWKEFRKELSMIKNNPDILYYLIKKYTSLIPSLSRDISLFDHIKITTAISTCLYKYMEGKPEEIYAKDETFFLLISGDLSGIQHFIYRVASPQDAQEGMAKRLRGRSLYLNLLNDAVVTRVIDDLELTEANILWCGGGNFQILAPYTDEIQKKIDKMKLDINNSLMNKFNSELFFGISVTEAGLNDLKNLSKSKELIESQLSSEKKQKFIHKLNYLFVDENKSPLKTCPVCDNPIIGDYQICKECDDHENLGQKLARATSYIKAIIKNEDEEKNQFDAILFGVGYKLITPYPEDKIEKNISDIAINSKKINIIKLNDTDFINEALLNKYSGQDIPVSYGFSFLANTVPVLHRKVLSFTHIAQLSKGANKLGILKMDVDHLGKIFRSGGNIATVSTMSSMLDFYFSGILNKICEKYYFLSEKVICEDCKNAAREIKLTFPEEENENERSETVYRVENGKECKKCLDNRIPAIYINYAGGDDLLIIGPWDNIIELAKDIRQKFIEFTCHNADIHISGGVFISDNKFPIGRAVSHADDLLKKSKNCGRDRVSVFGETVMWKSKDPVKGFYEIFDFTIELENQMDKKELSKGFIYSLLEMWKYNFRGSKNPNDCERCEKRAYIPHLKYKLARAVKDRTFRDELDKKIQKIFPWIKIPVSWCSLRTR